MDSQALTALAIGAGGLAVVAAVIAVAALRTLSRVRAGVGVLSETGRPADFVSVTARQHARVERVAADVAALASRVDAVTEDVRASLRHVAIIRYDAFGDMGGRLSFSAAVVDDECDGIVLSSIHARGESRTYAKGVIHGVSSVTLTPEEQQALDAARRGGGRARPANGEPA